MKKLLLLTSIIIVFGQNAKACDCNSFLNTFCKSVEAITDKSIVVRVIVEERDNYRGKLRILNLYKGNENKLFIQVWGNNGAICRDNIGNVGQTLILILHRIEKFSQFPLEEKEGDYLTGSICTISHLLVENGKIKGRITENEIQTVDDSDPNRLPFCPNFKTDLEILQSMIIAPNPTENIFYLKNLTGETEIEIFDILGRKIQQKAILQSQNFIDVADLAVGLYIVRLRKNAAVHAVKFIKV